MAHALVLGASGLCGWGTVEQLLLNYPKHGTFSTVTALVNRPLEVKDSYWPTSKSTPHLNLVSGIDLLSENHDEFVKSVQEQVLHIDSVTHIFYFAYRQEHDPELEVRLNLRMLSNIVETIEQLSPNLKFVAFPSGTKAYGIQVPGGALTAPLKESMVLSSEHDDKVYYTAFQRYLSEASKGKLWTWCDVRPDAIIGFTPHGSNFNLTAHWANYLSTFALVEGKGTRVPYPGVQSAYASRYTEVSASTIARFVIWASLHPERTGGQVFNIADQAKPSTMEDRWPALCRYFGVEGIGPSIDPANPSLVPGDYLQKHKNVLEERGIKGSQVFRSEFLDGYGYHFTFDRQLSLEKLRQVGFEEEIDPNIGWFKAFDRFREAGMIPKS
ncbi:sirq protein [Phlyctema vagabunda]|uniref:Sirq protein n=1 Tax=Phlyctema vagabunda TaxID=108571 RepID=A0ABR4P2U4_9HELO